MHITNSICSYGILNINLVRPETFIYRQLKENGGHRQEKRNQQKRNRKRQEEWRRTRSRIGIHSQCSIWIICIIIMDFFN